MDKFYRDTWGKFDYYDQQIIHFTISTRKKLWKVNDCGCGYVVTWTPKWLVGACKKHDFNYDAHAAGLDTRTREEVDLEFLKDCLELAGNNYIRKLHAYSYYYIARALGGLVW